MLRPPNTYKKSGTEHKCPKSIVRDIFLKQYIYNQFNSFHVLKLCYHCTMQVLVATGQQRWWWCQLLMMAESLASYFLSTSCRLDTSVRMETWCLRLCGVIVSTLWSWSCCICIC